MRTLSESDELKKAVLISLFASVAVALGIVESFIPFTVSIPGAKLGLGNIMILACLYFFNGRDALSLLIIKTILTSLLLGSFSTFIFSFLGALFSYLI